MTIAALVAALVSAALSVASMFQARKATRLDSLEHGKELAAQAVAYAGTLGGSGPEKLAHAMDAFRKLDEGDNGVRDFNDGQTRILIEAALKR